MSAYQKTVPRNEKERRCLDSVAKWASYYRANPHEFAKDFLHLHLHIFQKILLVMMFVSTTFVFIACRGIGKTYISAIFCCIRCILYPGTKICIASGTRGQSNVVLEKIINELKPNSPELAYEINDKETHLNGTIAQIVFHNGSYIKVVTASDSSRGNRANILIIDEFRMVKKDVIDTILKKFLANPRHPQYLNLPQYKHSEKRESNKTMYLSSAYYQDHWSYQKTKDTCKSMLNDKSHQFVCGFPYQLSLKEGLLMYDGVLEQMTESDFNEIKWGMEMDALFFGDSTGSFFNFESIAKNRKIEYGWLPESIEGTILGSTKFKIPPKQSGEKRILSADIALMSSTKHQNDATAIFVNQLVPTKACKYVNNIMYTQNNEGERTEDQALIIRKLYEEFDCDYIVLDTKGLGLGVYDYLSGEIVDAETGEVYPALSCCNNPDLAARCTDKNAKKVIWSIMGNPKFNSDIACLLREGFRSGKIRLLINEIEAEKVLSSSIKGFSSLRDFEKEKILLPYINTTLLINELINLQHEETSGLVKVYEKSGYRKDRYSSLAYNYYVSTQLEKSIRRRNNINDEYNHSSFLFRPPKIRSERR